MMRHIETLSTGLQVEYRVNYHGIWVPLKLLPTHIHPFYSEEPYINTAVKCNA